MHKSRLMLNRRVYVGISILDPSKHLMYEWYYHHLEAQHGGRAELLYTDTDSLVRKVQTEELYADMAYNADQYDTSKDPRIHRSTAQPTRRCLGR